MIDKRPKGNLAENSLCLFTSDFGIYLNTADLQKKQEILDTIFPLLFFSLLFISFFRNFSISQGKLH